MYLHTRGQSAGLGANGCDYVESEDSSDEEGTSEIGDHMDSDMSDASDKEEDWHWNNGKFYFHRVARKRRSARIHRGNLEIIKNDVLFSAELEWQKKAVVCEEFMFNKSDKKTETFNYPKHLED